MPPQRQRRGILVAERVALRNHAKAHPELSQKQLMEWFERQFGRRIGQPTISESLSSKYAAVDNASAAQIGEAKQRLRVSQWPELEAALYQWIQENEGQGPIIGDRIKEQAEHIWSSLPQYQGMEAPAFSNGWLQGFKTRHHIEVRKRQPRDSIDVDYSWPYYMDTTAEDQPTVMPSSHSIAITYVPADCGSIIPGKSKAPKAFQDVGIVERLRVAGLNVTEHSALDSPATHAVAPLSANRVRNEELNIFVCQRVHDTLTEIFATFPVRGPFQLILGGECCMTPAILSAYWQYYAAQTPPKRVGLVYIDADTDLASPTDPESTGIFAGMTMTHLLGRPGALASMKPFSRNPNGDPVCDSSNTVFFGTNMSLEANKRDQHLAELFDQGFTVVSSAAVAREPEIRARKALQKLEGGGGVDAIHVHLDVDAIDPLMFPLANVPNFTGVSFEAMMRALEVFLASPKVVGLTIAEVNPDHDPRLEMVDRLTERLVGMLARRAD